MIKLAQTIQTHPLSLRESRSHSRIDNSRATTAEPPILPEVLVPYFLCWETERGARFFAPFSTIATHPSSTAGVGLMYFDKIKKNVELQLNYQVPTCRHSLREQAPICCCMIRTYTSKKSIIFSSLPALLR